MPKLFGTDGIRGIANHEPLVPRTVTTIGEILGRLCRRSGAARVLIGRDTRRSGDLLQNALAAGVCAAGANPWLAGVLPTPSVAYLSRALEVDVGVVISGSHNPFPDNGIKLFGPDGFKIPDSLEERIEQELAQGANHTDWQRPTGADVGAVTFLADAADRYLRGLARLLPSGAWLRGIHLCVDAAHGAAYEVAPQAFEAAGATVHAIGTMPDGCNINDGCGATHPERIREETMRTRSQLGVALDGDGDRVVIVDENGTVLDGDAIVYVLARFGRDLGLVRSPVVVGTVMSNWGLERSLNSLGMRLLRVPVGDRHVSAAMVREGSDLGGEPSGHVVLGRRATTGDGLLVALTVLEVARRTGLPVGELARGFERVPQVLRNVAVRCRAPLDELQQFQRCLREAEAALKGRGRVLVRYSGTEPVVRVMVEAEGADQAQYWAACLAEVLAEEIGTRDSTG